jgi:hypothetical protein
MNTINDVIGITVTHNTRELIQNAYESVRRFHPDMQIIIIDGSDRGDPCYEYVCSLASDKTTVGVYNFNIGHGRGMDAGIRICKTKFALIFDSDIVMIKSPVEEMLAMMEADTYGVGYVEKSAYDGFEYGAKPQHIGQPFMYMLHPFFHLLQISEYFKFHPYVHHGAPAYLAALDIHKKGLTNKIIKILPNLGHTHGKGHVWDSIKPVWVIHDTAGTRKDRVKRGKTEIEGTWDYGKDSSIGNRSLFKRI